MFLAFMLVFRLFWLFILMVEPQVLSLIQEMEYLIQCPFMKDMPSHMLYNVFIQLVEISLVIFKNFQMRGDTHSPLMQKLKSLRTLKKECAQQSMIMKLQKKMPRKVIMSRKIMNYLMEERFLLVRKGSKQLRFFSNHKKEDLTFKVSTNIAMTLYLNAMLM